MLHTHHWVLIASDTPQGVSYFRQKMLNASDTPQGV